MATLHVRCDGGPGLGLGHVVGSLRLVRLIEPYVADVRFHCRSDAATQALVETSGYAIDMVAADITPDEDIAMLAGLGPEAVVAVNFCRDDLASYAERFHELSQAGVRLIFQDNPVPPGWRAGDVVINALPHPEYDGYHPDDHPGCLDGLEYFLPDSRAVRLRRQQPRRRFDRVSRVLIAMGGGRSGSAVVTVLAALRHAEYEGEVDVVVGTASTDVGDVEADLNGGGLNSSLTVGARDLPERMLAADIGFSALGLTTYEMAYTGLPVLLVTASALNAAAAERYCQEYAAAIHLGRHDEVLPADVTAAFEALVSDPVLRRNLSEHGERAVGSRTDEVRRVLRDLLHGQDVRQTSGG